MSTDVIYANNMSVQAGVPDSMDLKMDVYEPQGDSETSRPLVIYLHTGSFLPILNNNKPTGVKTDSAAIEMCKRFAKRGYVAASIDYRLGWQNAAPEEELRAGSFMQAVYRGMQDAKSCVRYFKKDFSENGNTYKIDTGRIVVVGEGAGGFVALAYASLNKTSELQLPRFISSITTGGLFTADSSFVQQSLLGDFEGFGGLSIFNTSNHAGYNSAIQMAVNLGGAMLDSSWLEAGEIPLVAFHVPNDPFVPYDGDVMRVPTTVDGDTVMYVYGSRSVIATSEALGNQAVFNIPYNDPYTTRANQVNEGFEGLFPFIKPDPATVFDGQTGPWEWVNISDLQTLGTAMGISSAQVNAVHQAAMFTNPNINDKAHAMTYIDSIHGYLAPRIVQVLQLPGFFNGLESLSVNHDVALYPNPAKDFAMFRVSNGLVESVELVDMTGKSTVVPVQTQNDNCRIETSFLQNGIYVMKVKTTQGLLIARLVKQ